MTLHRRRIVPLAVLTITLLHGSAHAQPCERQWQPLGQPSDPIAGTDGTILDLASMVMPSGERVVIAGGAFNFAGATPAKKIAAYSLDTRTWSGLGAGFNRAVQTVLGTRSGDVIAAGEFTMSGSAVINGVARYRAGQWTQIGNGLFGDGQPNLDPIVYDLIELPNGDLVAAGSFAISQGGPIAGVATWDGVQWKAIAERVNAPVFTLIRDSTGGLIAGGDFTRIADVATPHIARWDGQVWCPLGDGLNRAVMALAKLPDGSIFAGGEFSLSEPPWGGYSAIWTGARWQLPRGGWLSFAAFDAGLLDSRELVAVGEFVRAGETTVNYVAKWDQSEWTGFGTGLSGPAYALAVLPGDELVVAGAFDRAGSAAVSRIARWGDVTPNYANCDNSTGTPALTPADFSCFLAKYRAGDAYANCDNSTGAPALSPADFSCFLARYRAGCP